MAKKLNRRSISIEKEKKYIPIIKQRLRAICENDFKHLRINEPEKKSAVKVSMQELIQSNYIKKRQKIYTKDKTQSAIVLANGDIKNAAGTGSIHKIGALTKQSASCNGWMFWHYEHRGKLVRLDEYRRQYRERQTL